MHLRRAIKHLAQALLVVGLVFATAKAAEDDLLCRACRAIYLDTQHPIFPRAVERCATHPEKTRTWCIASNLATFYRAREQVAEFAVLYDNLLGGCPAQQAREYFKERLYYLATQ